jgi:Tol biopolymer transport system component
VVFYEMLTARRAFHRDTSVETLNAILKEEPAEFPPDRQIPPALDRVVRHCLEKKPEDRFQSARDLAFELEGLTGSSVTAAKAAAPASRWRRWLAGAVVNLVVLAALAGAFLVGRRTAPPNIPSYRQITFGRGFAPSGRFTPDGKTVVYSAAWNGGPPEIYSARTDAAEARLLGLPHGHVASLSSKGELAILLTEYPVYPERPATLARVPFSGGTPRPVAENVTCADWAPDGETLAVQHVVGGQRRIEFPLGRVLARGSVGCPRFSPDGKRLAFGVADGYQGIELATGRVFTVRGATGYVHDIFWAWSPRGDEIWFTGSERVEERPLRAVSLSGRQRVLDRIAGAAGLFDVSRDGLALIEHAFARWAVRARGPGEAADRDVSIFDRTSLLDISTDGRKVLPGEWGAAAGERSYAHLRSTDGSPPMRVGEGAPTALSPDGRWVLLDATPWGASQQRLLLVPTGTGQPQTVSLGELRMDWASWTPDGRRILIVGRERDKGPRVFVQATDGSGRRAVTPEGVFPRLEGTRIPVPVSDGRRVAVPGPNGHLTLYRLDDGAEPREVPGVGPGFLAVRFGVDGRSLLVAGPEATPTRVYRVDLVTGRRTLLHELMPADTAGVTTFEYAFVTSDGRSYAYAYRQILQQLYLVEGLK